jgi:hypothetical protein
MKALRAQLTKIVVGTPGKKTRFHTRRGELVPLREWPAAGGALLRRIRGKAYDRPWLAPQAVQFLERIIEPGWVVAELGAGASTAWFGRRAGRVLSLESDPSWADQVEATLTRVGLRNVEVHLVPLGEFDDALARVAAKTPFDLIVVDQLERETGARVESIRRGWQFVRPGGYLVLDDSDWATNAGAFDLLVGWSHRRFVGVRPSPFQATETTVFRRPIAQR